MVQISITEKDMKGSRSVAEAVEQFIIIGINSNRQLFPVLDDIELTPSSEKVAKKYGGTRRAISGIKLGAKIGNAGNLPENSAYKPSVAGKKSIKGMHPEPKTDIVVGSIRMSVKDFTRAHRAESIESHTFKYIFDKAYKDFTKKLPEKAIDHDIAEEIKHLISDTLDAYRTGSQKGSIINALFGLEGAKEVDKEKQDRFMKYILDEDFSEEIQQKIISNAHKLFSDIDFKKEIIKQALTGEYKFGKNSKSTATHILYYNLSNLSFSVKKIDDQYITEAAKLYEISITTGRKKTKRSGSFQIKARGQKQKLPNKFMKESKSIKKFLNKLAEKAANMISSIRNFINKSPSNALEILTSMNIEVQQIPVIISNLDNIFDV